MMLPSNSRAFLKSCHILSRNYFQFSRIVRKSVIETSNIIPNISQRSTNYSTEKTIHVSENRAEDRQINESSQSNKTYSDEELNKFRGQGDDWWQLDGDFKLLHSMNDLRIPFIRDGLIQTGAASDLKVIEGPKCLSDICILDIGCGGGLLSEPLARLGANVTGIDATEEGIIAATNHAKLDPKLPSNLSYKCCTVEDHSIENFEKYDAVVISEVLEHVPSVDAFLSECTKCLKPGGSLFITTINRTTQSYLGAILAAEYVLGLVPRGTHDWNKFVKVEDLIRILKEEEFGIRQVHGMFCIPPLNKWCWVSDTSVNYAVHAVKKQ